MLGMARRVRSDRFLLGLGLITALGLGVRLIYVLGFHRHDAVWGDAFYYHFGANYFVKGKGFIAPMQYTFTSPHRRIQAAEHPPLYTLFLAFPSAIGLGTTMVHRIWSALLGSATVFVSGLLGRRVAGNRVGLISAALVAISPNVWVYDAQLLSETLAIFVATLAVLLAYRAWDAPSARRVCALAVACGAAGLVRSELVLLVPALLWPIAFHAAGPGVRQRVRVVGVGTLVSVLVMLPWVAYNLTRFEHPVLVSTQLEATLAGANCEDTYHGERLGLLSSTCLYGLDPFEDQSVKAQILRDRVKDFVSDNLSRVPVVVAVRVGRVAGLYEPSKQINVDIALERKERPLATIGLYSSYFVAIGAIAGAVMLRRRLPKRPVYPLVVLPAIALFTVAAMYGTTRFRASAETSLLVLAAVALDGVWRRLTRVASTDEEARDDSLSDAMAG
jgi:4-amino-4-deoxy-L-arabinose transferase-like glycosyltransferase